MVTVVVAYGSLRAYMLYAGNRPTISSYKVQGERNNEVVDLNKFKFQVAFSIRSITDR